MMITESILLVDDEVKVISSLCRSLLLEDFCEIKSALNGQEALEIVKKTPDLAVIISDYHMPDMNGIDFLEQSRKISPDSTRILLTGVADLEMAIEAINRGKLFRFLIKPCSSEMFISTVKDGIRQYQLIIGERELLSKTLYGSVKVMVDILAVLNPDIFNQVNRLRNLARDLTSALDIEELSWEIELAALLSQIGAVTIPRNILVKWQSGGSLEETEKDMIQSIPKVSKQLIRNIPRLERIADAVNYQNRSFSASGDPKGEEIPLIARILKVIIDFDRFCANTDTQSGAIQAMLKRESQYDPRILEVFKTRVVINDKPVTGGEVPKKGEKGIYVGDLKPGMVLSRSIFDKNNTLIVARGTTITEVLVYKLENFFRTQALVEPVYVESLY